MLLGDLYVRERLDDFYVIPEKDSYAPGEKANLIVFSDVEADLLIEAPGLEPSVFPAGPKPQLVAITLPDYMIEGTYTITYRRDYETRTTSFDVAGETIRVAEARLAGANRSVNAPGDTVTLELDIIPKFTGEVTVVTSLAAPFKDRVELDRQKAAVEPGILNTIRIGTQLRSIRAGTHELYYDILSHGMPVTGGRLLVEIGSGKLVSLVLEPHQVSDATKSLQVRLETEGSGEARLMLNLDGKPFVDETVKLSGFEVRTFGLPLSEVTPGMHYVQGVMYLKDCLSDRSDWFELVNDYTVATPTPDLGSAATPKPETGDADALAVSGPGMDSGDGEPLKPPEPDDSASGNPVTAEPEQAGEILSIPTLNLFGILILILLVGAILARIGGRR